MGLQHSVATRRNQAVNMYKLILLPLFFAAVSAGYLGGPAVATYAAAPIAVAAPVVAAPVAVKAVAPVATSYANVHKVDIATPIVKTIHAPVAYAAPAVVKAPIAVAAPVAVAAPALHAAPLAYASYGYHG